MTQVDDGRKFTLEGRVLKLNSATDAESLVAEINSLGEQLEEIVFSGSTFGVDAAAAIADALSKKPNLKIVNFSDIFTGRLKDEIPRALDAFVNALVDKEHFKVIDLSDNAFGPIGAAPIRRLFIENRSITTLKLNNNGLGIEGGRLIATSLQDAAKANTSSQNLLPNMHTIIMGRNRLETVAAQHLSNFAFPVLPNLRELRMPQNGIRPDGIQVLLESLAKYCVNLEVLDLQDNTFTKQGSKALASALPSWSKLHTLNVGDCLLSAPGSKLVFKSFSNAAVTPQLHTLIFTFNEMDISGAKLIPNVLAVKKALTTLHLNGNCFDAEDDVVEEIRGGLRRNAGDDGVGNGLDELEDMEDVDSEAEQDDELDDVDEEAKIEEDGKGKNGKDDVDELADALGGGLKV